MAPGSGAEGRVAARKGVAVTDKVMQESKAPSDIREAILKEIEEQSPKGPMDATLQQGTILDVVARKLQAMSNPDLQRAILTQWHELFRTGLLAWGDDIANPNPPFFHLTATGRNTLARLTRDPGNPAGYLRHVDSFSELNAIARSYLTEGLDCYVHGQYKAAAVMVGAAAESMIVELKDVVVGQLKGREEAIPPKLKDWRIKTITDGLAAFIEGRLATLPHEIRETFQANWSALAQQIRVTRNDAGHPLSIDPVSFDRVHASLLIFPELAKLVNSLANWGKSSI